MDKNAIKKYAIWARRDLIEKVSQKALLYGIEEGKELDLNADSINGILLSETEKKQRQALIRKINSESYTQVIEEVAYTWFNRFIALRFMEVNGFLPSHVRVFSDENNRFKPQILSEALNLEFDGLDKEKIYSMKSLNQDDDLFKYLLIAQCNDLNSIFPYMFQTISDYTELLLPDYLLREGSVVEQLVTTIPEDNWTDQVQIIGWLYQYYNTEPKDDVFALLKKNVKVTKEKIPAATQLFTPDWIVRYMVENSLGRLWLDGHSDDKESLISEWKYYEPEAKQNNPEYDESLLKLIKEKSGSIKPEEIKCIDPCAGSGHILVYMFDILIHIYNTYGYSPREAAEVILKNNIYGLDIDVRAAQLASFALMMKARQYDRRIFQKNIIPNVYSLQGIDVSYENLGNEELKNFVKKFDAASEIGSLIEINGIDIERVKMELDVFEENLFNYGAKEKIAHMINIYSILNQKFDVVITNPPYMGASSMDAKLSSYVKNHFPDAKSDLFACFIEKSAMMTKTNGFFSMITQHSWMFLASYENLRKKMRLYTILGMAHLGSRAFEEISGEVVQTTCFVVRKTRMPFYNGTYVRLTDALSQNDKESLFLSGNNRYYAAQEEFEAIPGAPVSYWATEKIRKAFEASSLYECSISPSQNITGNNEKFVRKFWELSTDLIGDKDGWIFYAKGGGYRKWWGNLTDVINWTPQARYIYQHGDGKHASQIINKDYWYKKGITWGLITTNLPSFRVMPEGATYDKGGSTIIVDENVYKFTLGLLNSKIFIDILAMLNPTMNVQVKDVRSMPLILENEEAIEKIVDKLIELSRNDWNIKETSWEYERNPLVKIASESGNNILVEDTIKKWEETCRANYEQMISNERELNVLLAKAYGLEEDIDVDVKADEITLYIVNELDEIKMLISYAVGCMFGRYSLDVEGIICSSSEIDTSQYSSFNPDTDNIVPICDDEYFSDDIVGKFIELIGTVFGKDTLEDNLQYIANVLGGKGTSRDVIRNYFMNGFYADHLKLYQKRPIYWLFDSGKKNGFKCLIYMHRYQPDTIARIRTDYVHEQQARYRTAIEESVNRVDNVSGSEKVKLTKRITTLKAQEEEIHAYEEKVHHLADQMINIDLYDGVKQNYELFKDVLAKMK